MYTALYRAYRPEVFGEILGQEHIVKILQNQINTDTTSHAYLFCGTRGTGKTTTARILAKGLNCLHEGEKPCGTCSVCSSIKDGIYLDVVEIDAASNNGVDNIRELRESVKYPPAVGRKKVYIIDEVHMLSSGAFNALLKTLEEPPEYVTFILATTEPQKLPATILSRCMRLDFRRIPERVLMDGMADICSKRGIDVSEDALRIIASNADGSVRDGLSILDQCISGGEMSVDAKDVLGFLGASGEETFIELTDHVRRGKTADALLLLGQVLSDGKDVRQFMRDWVNHYRNLLMTKFIRDPQAVVNLSAENIERIRRQSNSIDLNDINRGILELSGTINEARWSTQPRILLELSIVKLSSNLSAAAASLAQSVKEPEPMGVPNPEPQLSKGEEPSVQPAQQPIQSTQSAQPTQPIQSTQSAQPAQPIQSMQPAQPSYDLDALWAAIIQDGENAKSSFYMIGSGGRLAEIGEEYFTVEVNSPSIKLMAEKDRRLLESLMEKHTGKLRVMHLAQPGTGTTVDDANIEKIARDAEKLLGINVTIQ